MHRLDEASADGEAEAGSGAAAVGAADAVELVEDVLQVGRRNAWALIDNLQVDLCRSPARR